jgi:Domain of unknown function (DUF1707)/Cell wall-active antibiotics response 4TMS YvqF
VDRPDVRASDDERERAVEILRDAAAEGRLTFEELADRLEVTTKATTRGQLEEVTADLPVTATVAGPAPTRPADMAPVKQSSLFGNVKRSGQWTLPVKSRWETVFGDVVLDLREARVTDAEVTIDAGTFFGDVELLVPEGVLVEVRAWTVFGDVKQDAGDTASPAAPRIVLKGGTVFGDVKVRARRTRERLADRLLGARSTP